jgi:rhodanese-related sulfurtransferase
MGEKVLVSPSELSDMMRTEPVVLIDTRDPAIYAEAHIPGAVDVREVFTYWRRRRRKASPRFATNSPQRSGRRVCPAQRQRSSTSNR